MKQFSNPIIDDIADTLYIPLLMKSHETRKKDPFFTDPEACRMVEAIDYDFSKYDGSLDSSVGIALRAKYFDEMTRKFILEHDNPVVVFLGCGLDTRYLRLGADITDRAVFYELDLPEAIYLREQLLPPAENDVFLPYSMFETGWMDQLKGKHPNGYFLFVVEGVFIYFEKTRVRSLITDLCRRFSGKLLFDVTSSWLCKNQHRLSMVKLTRAPFKLALDNDREIETWAPNLSLESIRHYGDFKDWKRAGWHRYWLARLIPTIKNTSRMICCKVKPM